MEAVGRILDASRSRMQKGFSALHLAVQSSLERLVQQLLVLPNTLVDAQDSDGLTALHWAASEGAFYSIECVCVCVWRGGGKGLPLDS